MSSVAKSAGSGGNAPIASVFQDLDKAFKPTAPASSSFPTGETSVPAETAGVVAEELLRLRTAAGFGPVKTTPLEHRDHRQQLASAAAVTPFLATSSPYTQEEKLLLSRLSLMPDSSMEKQLLLARISEAERIRHEEMLSAAIAEKKLAMAMGGGSVASMADIFADREVAMMMGNDAGALSSLLGRENAMGGFGLGTTAGIEEALRREAMGITNASSSLGSLSGSIGAAGLAGLEEAMIAKRAMEIGRASNPVVLPGIVPSSPFLSAMGMEGDLMGRRAALEIGNASSIAGKAPGSIAPNLLERYSETAKAISAVQNKLYLG